ncbi:hypothetical protein XFF6994_1890027 [Xanthomonas citri pv. fuscans]|nr:hypothetical protein XFF6994_1890027 [Xanthomonas citri pv. fuscans]
MPATAVSPTIWRQKRCPTGSGVAQSLTSFCMGWWVRGVAAAGMRRGGAAPRGLGAASQAGLDRAMQYGMLFAGVASVK